MSIVNSKCFTIKGKPTFNNVRGDQINSTTLNVGTLHYNGQIVSKRTEYDEFEYVKRGQVITLEEICSMELSGVKCKGNRLRMRDRGQKRVYSVELVDRQSKFTALVYEGEEAQDLWRKDFQQCSRNRNPNSCLLFALNHSEVPMLIFHHDLIPMAQLYTQSLWMNLYVELLADQMQCSLKDIWMDTSQGVFRTGPSGPMYMGLSFLPNSAITVPCTIDMLNPDNIFKFFRRFKSKALHQALLILASWLREIHSCSFFLRPLISPERSEGERRDLQSFTGSSREQLRRSLPGLRFDTVYSTSFEAVARWPQEAMRWPWTRWPDGLTDRTPVGELTRFSLCGDKIRIDARYDDDFSRRRSWLSQFSRCTEEEKPEDYFLIEPCITLESESPKGYNDSKIPSPIYLFLYPLKLTTISEFISWADGRTYFWSLDRNGQTEMMEDELEQWGVPKLTLEPPEIYLVSWSSSIYTALYDWQVARGFDPTTTDSARHLGYTALEILRPKEKKSTSWWEAIPGSGISAFAF